MGLWDFPPNLRILCRYSEGYCGIRFTTWRMVCNLDSTWILSNSQPITTVIVISFFAGIQLLSLGYVSEYISRINDEVKNRPMYIIEKKV